MECLWGEKVGELARRKALQNLSAYETRQLEIARQWEADRKVIAFKMIRETLEVAVCQELAATAGTISINEAYGDWKVSFDGRTTYIFRKWATE